jgi:hypothetical protein
MSKFIHRKLLKPKRFRRTAGFEYRPDLKGIKTLVLMEEIISQLFEYRPDLKGIKTMLFRPLLYYKRSLNTALI